MLREIHVHRAIELGATEIYLLHVGHLEERRVEIQRPFDGAMRAYWLARRHRLSEDLHRIPPSCVVHRMPAGSSPVLRFDDFSRGRELTELAYESCRAYLATGTAPQPKAGPRSEVLEEDADDETLGRQFADQTDLGSIDGIAESSGKVH